MTPVLDRLRARPYGLALALALVLLAANIAARPSFVAWDSWPANLANFAPFALAAIASTPAILSGGGNLDISIGPLLNFVTIFIVVVLIGHDVTSPWIIVPVALGLGAVVGAINGVMVAILRYQAVLATLCTLFVLQGISLKVASEPVAGSAPWLGHLAGKIGPVPGALVLIAIPLLLWAALRRTAFIRALFSVGGDDVAAYSAGVNVSAVRIVAFTLGGLVAGLGGIALAAATRSADAGQSIQYTLPAIAAVAIGGTSLLGGRGSLTGSVAGAAIMFQIQTLLDSLDVANTWLSLFYGALLLAAVVLSSVMATSRVGRAQTA
jgi:ribose transport system permease protein